MEGGEINCEPPDLRYGYSAIFALVAACLIDKVPSQYTMPMKSHLCSSTAAQIPAFAGFGKQAGLLSIPLLKAGEP